MKPQERLMIDYSERRRLMKGINPATETFKRLGKECHDILKRVAALEKDDPTNISKKFQFKKKKNEKNN